MTRFHNNNGTAVFSPLGVRAFFAKGQKVGSFRKHVCLVGGALLVFLCHIQRLNHAVLGRYDDALMRQALDFIPEKQCKALILNEGHTYCHYEVLESILALYPLPRMPSCNRLQIRFTISIADGIEISLWHQNLSASWYEYASQVMTENEYAMMEGQSRYLDKVIRNSSTPPTHGFDYQIRASCYCQNTTDVEWLFESKTHFRVFHETCDRVANTPRAMWVNPSMKPSFFPKVLPQFNHARIVDADIHNLCIIGRANRREYDYVAAFVERHPHYSGIEFHHFGQGPLEPHVRNFVTHHKISNFMEYQFNLFMTCDAILAQVTPVRHAEYFNGSTKLSGAVVQAAAYRLPILLHKDLASVYRKYLAYVETHGDDYDSFSLGLERLLQELTVLKAASNTTSPLPE